MEQTGRLRRGSCRACQGIASVELAIVAPVLIFIMFAIMEFGVLFSVAVQLEAMARTAARAAAAGESWNRAWQRTEPLRCNLDCSRLSLVLEYKEYLGDGQWADDWQPLQSDGSFNTAPANSIIRATVIYHHKLLLPGLFTFLVDDPEEGTKALVARVAMPRT